MNRERIDIDRGQYSIDNKVEPLEEMISGSWRVHCKIYRLDDNRYLQATLLCIESMTNDEITDILCHDIMAKDVETKCRVCIGTKDHYIQSILQKMDNIFIHRRQDGQVDMLGILHFKRYPMVTKFYIVKGYRSHVYAINQ